MAREKEIRATRDDVLRGDLNFRSKVNALSTLANSPTNANKEEERDKFLISRNSLDWRDISNAQLH